MPDLESIVESQLTSLDDTDALATAWAQALEAAASSNKLVWGGRGKGGRGLARRTYQRYDVVVEQVRLEYINQANLHCKVLLEGTTLKLLSPRVYVLVGINGVGKSTLLRRIGAGKIPGFPPHISSMYIPQEVIRQPDKTPMDIVLSHHDAHLKRSTAAHQSRIEQLEALMEDLDLTTEEGERQMQASCEQIAALEEQAQGQDVLVRQHAEEALRFFGFDRDAWDVPSAELSGGHLKKVVLACALFCQNDLLLLDEPTNFLDVAGLLQLRRLISICTERNTTILMVSHDVDLVNEVATDIIHMFGNQLNYYPGNYRDFVGYRAQQDLHSLRQNAALEKKREAIMTSIDNLKRAPIPKRGGGKKMGKQIEARKKKLEKVGLEKNELGHRWTAQKAGTGIREGSINSIDATTRKNMTYAQLLKQPETNVANAPDKAVQFVFRNPTSTWSEPVIMAMDVGHGYNVPKEKPIVEASDDAILKKDGYLFDCVDLCINEGSIVCLLGANGTGKTTLLRLLAGEEQPLEGKVHHAHNLSVGYFDQHVADALVEEEARSGVHTALSILALKYPLKTEQDLRGELTAFGLNPQQATTDVSFLSGGERCRVCLAALMLSDPDVLIMDEPTSHLDVESVDALVYGLKKWEGTLIMVSHDANFVRSLEGTCFVICQPEGKVLRVPGGIDFYLKSIKL